MAYTPPVVAVDNVTKYDAARDQIMNNGIAAAATAADAAGAAAATAGTTATSAGAAATAAGTTADAAAAAAAAAGTTANGAAAAAAAAATTASAAATTANAAMPTTIAARRDAVRSMMRNQVLDVGALPSVVMASPPTITWDASSATLSSPVTKTPPDCLQWGPTLTVNGSSFYFTPIISGSTASDYYHPWGLEFDFEGSRFELQYSTRASCKVRVLVDGQLVSAAPGISTLASQSGIATKWGLIDFGSRQLHRIRLEFDGTFMLQQIRMDITSSLSAAPRKGLTGLVMGDSYVAGVGADAQFTSFAYQLGRLLGWGNIITSGAPGSGYLKVGSNSMGTFRTRLPVDITPQSPNILVSTGGLNDLNTSTQSQMAAEAALLYAAEKTALPVTDIYVVSAFWSSGTPGATRLGSAAGIVDGATAQGMNFINVLTNPGNIITGSGTAGAPASNGNADFYTNADTVHPTQAGHNFYARQIAARMVATWPARAAL